MAYHMVPRMKVVTIFDCPGCGAKSSDSYVLSYPREDLAACVRKACRHCGIEFRVSHEDDGCLSCGRRIDCLVLPIIVFAKAKVYKEKIPTWVERIERVRKRGVARVKKNGNIHRALKTFSPDGKSSASALRGSHYTMWEAMMMLTYGFIEKHGPMGNRGGFYTINELGKEAKNQLDISGCGRGQLVELKIDISDFWFTYFQSHQW